MVVPRGSGLGPENRSRDISGRAMKIMQPEAAERMGAMFG